MTVEIRRIAPGDRVTDGYCIYTVDSKYTTFYGQPALHLIDENKGKVDMLETSVSPIGIELVDENILNWHL